MNFVEKIRLPYLSGHLLKMTSFNMTGMETPTDSQVSGRTRRQGIRTLQEYIAQRSVARHSCGKAIAIFSLQMWQFCQVMKTCNFSKFLITKNLNKIYEKLNPGSELRLQALALGCKLQAQRLQAPGSATSLYFLV